MKALIKVFDSILKFCTDKTENNNFDGFSFKNAEHTWSKKEIIGHLIDSAFNNHRRFLLAPDMDGYFFEEYNQNQWVLRNSYHQKDAKDLLKFLVSINRHFLELVDGMSFEFLTQKTTRHNFHAIGMLPVKEGESLSLSYFFYDYLYHLEHHLRQIFTGYQLKLKPMNTYKCI